MVLFASALETNPLFLQIIDLGEWYPLCSSISSRKFLMVSNVLFNDYFIICKWSCYHNFISVPEAILADYKFLYRPFQSLVKLFHVFSSNCQKNSNCLKLRLFRNKKNYWDDFHKYWLSAFLNIPLRKYLAVFFQTTSIFYHYCYFFLKVF